MAKRIGILGGISHESTIRYYDAIMTKYHQRTGDHYYPEVVIFSLNLQRFTDFEDQGDHEGYLAEIMTGVGALERAGVDLIIMAANSPHAFFGDVASRSRVPILSIVDATVERAVKLGLRRLLLLGIRFTMQSSFYPYACRAAGIEVVVPAGDEQDEINSIIFEELVNGLARDSSRQRLVGIINRHPVDGVILGCTELPLLLRPEDSTLPLLDTLDLHAEAALAYAMSD
jgi:aspartate racemase